VTAETPKDTDPWMKSLDGKYAYAYERSGKLMSELGCNGYPSAALVNASGMVIWVGHPASIPNNLIQEAIQGALPKPVYEWPASASAAAAALRKKKYADAIAAAAKIPDADGGPAIKTALEAVVSGKVEGLKSAREKGDFLTAFESAKALQKELVGLPQAKDADAIADEISTDAQAKKIMAAQKRLREIRGQRLGKKNEREKAIEDLEKMIEGFPDTYLAKEAKSTLSGLKQKK